MRIKFICAIAISSITYTFGGAAFAAPPSATSDSNRNTACGTLVMPNVSGTDNTGIGDSALGNDGTGSYNTAIGYQALFANSTGASNTASGTGALYSNSSGASNTAGGTEALYSNTIGSNNTANGALALSSNTSGNYNTAAGEGALALNSTGFENTAVGASSLYSNTTGGDNTAIGHYVLVNNTTGGDNTAIGHYALLGNTTGNLNTASGAFALYNNTTGNSNSATGYEALLANKTGSGNNAQGYQAMYSNTTGVNNLGIGQQALYNWTGTNIDASAAGRGNNAIGLTALFNMQAGERNTAVGNNAGYYLGHGAYNTYIGWQVGPGQTSPTSTAGTITNENYVTRIGVTYNDPNIQPYNPKAYIAGIFNSDVIGGVPVYVNSAGQLGFSASSERYKTDIHPLAADTDKLSRLRPVSFHVKSDPDGALQYGLVAEEVNKVYPELVIRDADGKIQGVRYDELAPMLLNEMQKSQTHVVALDGIIAAQASEIASLKQKVADVDDLKQQLSGVIQELKARDNLLAHR
jgi:hypothetical protein